MSTPEDELTIPKYPIILSYTDVEILQLALQKYAEHLKSTPTDLTISRSEVLQAAGELPDDIEKAVSLEPYLAAQYGCAQDLDNRLSNLL